MTLWLSLILSLLASSALAIGFVWRDRRTRAARNELARSIHQQALRLDQRCDHLQTAIDELRLEQRLLELARLVDDTVAERGLSPRAAGRLRGAMRELATNARDVGRAGR